MADQTITDRLQPSLLDRLTDLAPSEKTELREARVIDMRELREIIQRDLSWLLNTNNSGSLIDAERFPTASESVINFGVRETSGDYSSGQRADEIRKSIAAAIERFEPRIRQGSTDVTLQEGDEQSETIVSFDIRADMWAQPVPMELYLRSEIDITTGELNLERVV